MIRPAETTELAREFIVFCDGLEEGGLVEYARRGRNLARAAIETAEQLAAARSMTAALSADRDRLRDLLAARVPVGTPEPEPEP